MRGKILFGLAIALLLTASLYWSQKNQQDRFLAPSVAKKTIDFYIARNKQDRVCLKKDIDLNFSKDSARVDHDPSAVRLIREGCYWVVQATVLDTLDKEKQLIGLNVAPAGCGSCHTRELFVLEGDAVVFHDTGDNPNFQLSRAGDRVVFMVTKALTQPGEPNCHTRYGERTYEWVSHAFRLSGEKILQFEPCQ